MPKYEIWKKSDWDYGTKAPDDTATVIDVAIDKAKQLSKKLGKYTTHLWSWKSKKDEEVEQDNIVVVIERTATARVCGIASGGKWHWARDCKRCNNSGQDTQFWGLVCRACNGASIKAK